MSAEELKALREEYLTKASEAESNEEFETLLEMAIECRQLLTETDP